MKPESVFRQTKVVPFLKTLKNTIEFPIQQISIRGTPDFLLCSSGVFVGLELKTDEGKLDDLQEYNLSRITKCGGVSIVARPRSWERIKLQLRIIDRGEYYD